jgi:hypothetical protein
MMSIEMFPNEDADGVEGICMSCLRIKKERLIVKLLPEHYQGIGSDSLFDAPIHVRDYRFRTRDSQSEKTIGNL